MIAVALLAVTGFVHKSDIGHTAETGNLVKPATE
jgi:hypothetical protein